MPDEEKKTRGPYRPRLERSQGDRHRIEITDRDLSILQLIGEHRVLTPALLSDALELGSGIRPSPTNLAKRLAGMFHGGYLDRILPARGATFGGDLFAYAMAAKGEKLLRERQLELPFERGSNWKRRNEKLKALFVRHSLMVSRARIAIGLGLREVPSLMLEVSEREGSDLVAVWERGRRRCKVVPDGLVVLAEKDQPDRRINCFLEADRDTMERRRMLAKIEDYGLLAEDGLDREIFGVRDFLVLLIAETKARANFLLTLASEAEPSSPIAKIRRRILVTSEETFISRGPNILAQVWRSAGRPDERAAIIPSPLPRR